MASIYIYSNICSKNIFSSRIIMILLCIYIYCDIFIRSFFTVIRVSILKCEIKTRLHLLLRDFRDSSCLVSSIRPFNFLSP